VPFWTKAGFLVIGPELRRLFMKKTNSRIKVFVILPYLHQGGTQRHVSYLIENIDKSRFEVHLGYFINHDVFYKSLLTNSQHSHVFGKGEKVTPLSWLSLIRTIRKVKPDILHYYMQSANFLGGFAHYFSPKIPLIFSVGMTRQPSWHYRLYRFLRKRPTLTFCNSRKIREELITQAGMKPEKLLVVHNPLDTDRFRPLDPQAKQKARAAFGFRPDSLVLASIGRISHQKNQLSTVQAVHRLQQRGEWPESARLILVGKCQHSDYERELRKRIADFGLQETCPIWEPIEDIVSFYNAVDGVFQPSHHEGLSNVAIECQASGVPVALSREGDNDDLIDDGKTGVSFSIGKEEEITTGLKRLIDLCSNPQRRGEVVRRAREQVTSRFSLAEAMKLREEIYENLAGVRS
jgi:glycosyltransferase involved in cell wall biosynthesis